MSVCVCENIERDLEREKRESGEDVDLEGIENLEKEDLSLKAV